MTVVVFDRTGDLDWLSSLGTEVKIVLYTNRAVPVSASVRIAPTLSSVSATFLTHIVTHYETFEGPLLFADRFIPNPLILLKERVSGVRELGSKDLLFDDEGLPHLLGSPLSKKGIKVGTIYKELFREDAPPLFYCRASSSFRVESETLRLRSKEFFKRAAEIALEIDDLEAGTALSDFVFERLWHQIFRPISNLSNDEILPGMNTPLPHQRVMLLGPYIEGFLKSRMREDKRWGYRLLTKANEALLETGIYE